MSITENYKNRMYRWRERSPLRMWRQEKGFGQDEAARLLGLHPATYERYEAGTSTPRKIGNTYCVGVRTALMEDRKDYTWDDWVEPRTGVSFAMFSAWMMERPKVERC